MRRRLASPAFAFVLGLSLGTAALTGCSGTSTGTAATPSTTTAPSPSASAAPPAPAPAPSASASAPAGASIGTIGGQGVALPSGVNVSVGKIATYPDSVKPGNGVTRGGDQYAVIPITLANKSDKPLDVTLTAVTVTARGEQADGVIEPDRHPTDNGFPGTLLPGKTRTATFGYILRKGDLADLQIEVWPTQAEPHAIINTTGSTT